MFQDTSTNESEISTDTQLGLNILPVNKFALSNKNVFKNIRHKDIINVCFK